jgi:arsenite methyltransferase
MTGATEATADYGIDAPGVIRNLVIIGLSAAIGAWLAPLIAGTAVVMPLRLAAALAAVICFAEAVLMLIYARIGKFRHRDRMLAQVPWRGDEHVVDIGTGRGLLLIGAAKRLTSGRATGIDIWNPSDLRGNARYRTMRNLVAEGVADRCDLLDEPAQELSLADASADVVLSNLCLHNIVSHAERDRACRQIARVLKSGGCALISDFRFTNQYGQALQHAGLVVTFAGPYLFDTFPPLRLVCARKT